MSFFNQPSIIISEDIPLSVLHRALVLQVACIADAYSMLLHCCLLTAWSKIGMPWGHTVLMLGPSLYIFAHVGDGNGLCDGWGFHVLCRCSNDLLATFWPFFPWWYFVVDADLHWKGSLSCMCHPSNFHRSRLDYRPGGGITFFCVGEKGLKKWTASFSPLLKLGNNSEAILWNWTKQCNVWATFISFLSCFYSCALGPPAPFRFCMLTSVQTEVLNVVTAVFCQSVSWFAKEFCQSYDMFPCTWFTSIFQYSTVQDLCSVYIYIYIFVYL